MKTTLKLATVLVLGVVAACGGSNDNPSNLKPVTVTVSPNPVTVDQGGTATFSATVTNSTNTGVTWSVQQPSGGTIDQSGNYTAPAQAGTFTVVATSKADSSAKGTAVVTVNPIQVEISPATATLASGQTQTFTATVTGTSNTAVTWSVVENGGGTIDSSGVYTAPASGGTYHVRATSVANTTESATATVTVSAVSVAISPADPVLNQGQTQQFTATVTGAATNNVTWSIDEASGGSIDTTGLYTPPAAAGFYHVRATSVDDPTKSAVTSAHVLDVRVAISGAPASAVEEGSTTALTATVTGAVDTSVTWSSSPAGLVDASGHFSAPMAAGQVTVTATSNQKTTASASVVIDVQPVALSFSAPSSIDQGGTANLTATVTGAVDKTVTWSSSPAGLVDSSGHFTAPFAAGPVTVTATSNVDATATQTSTITVNTVNIAVSGPTTIDQGGTGTFTATVTGTTATGITWSASAGTIDASTGAFTAPFAAGDVTITATSTQNASDKGTAIVTGNSVSITITPANPTLTAGQAVTFSAAVTGTVNTTVGWSADCGTIDSVSGAYTAPSTPGACTITATSASDATTQTTTATIPTATGIAYADPTGTGWRLVKDTNLSTSTHLVLDLVGPTGGSGRGVGLDVSNDASTAFAPVQAGDTKLVENVAYALGTSPNLMEGLVSSADGHLKVGVFQKGTTQADVSYVGPLLSIAVDYAGTGEASGIPLSLSASGTELPAAGSAPAAIPVEVGQLSAQ